MSKPFAWIGLHEANFIIDIAYDGLVIYDDSLHSRFVAACALAMSMECRQRIRVIQHYALTEAAMGAIDTRYSVYHTLPPAFALMAVSSEEAREMYLCELAVRSL